MGDEALLPLRLFQNRTVGIASIASVIIGMGMFGGIACLPLYLQIVKGASPTAGRPAAAADDARHHGRLDHLRPDDLPHRPLPASSRSSARPCWCSSLFGFHYVGADTPLWQTMIVMVVFGLGLGFNMQPLTLAVQNAVSPRDIGVATSSATFSRQIGGTLGTAVFLSILFSAVPDRLQTAFRTIAPSPDFQAALKAPQGNAAANHAFISGLQGAQSGGSGGAFDGA